MSALVRLAEEVGIAVDWEDAAGEAKHVSSEALVRVLGALGYRAGSEAEIAASRERHRQERAELAFLSADCGAPVELPEGVEAREIEVELENGGTLAFTVGEDRSFGPIDEPGYHRLVAGGRELVLAIAPASCPGIEDFAAGERIWGPAVQVPALRGADDAPFGDFAILAEAATRFAEAGADVLAISPVHALFPADPARFSPYGPSSREFLNVVLASPATGSAGEGGDALIDWQAAIPARMAALEARFAARDAAEHAAFRAWRSGAGGELERQAIYDALHSRFRAEGAGGWQDWPAAYRDAASPEVARFAGENAATVDFYAYAQWLAALGLQSVQDGARGAGMRIGLIADLAVGVDPGGSQAWSRGGEMLEGLSIGAPPDLLGPEGQDWGLTSFSPRGLARSGFAGYIAMVRAALRHAGGVRIDHILGLNRLWVIPRGQPSSEGAYLRYPLADLLRVLAIEAGRAGAIVIGEDLGTVPEGLRPRLAARGVAGMRVLWFERDEDGAFIPPEDWESSAVALTGTHDLVTIAGWWTGRDIDWNVTLGRVAPGAEEQRERARRDTERAELWQAMRASGAASGEPPATHSPARAVDAATRHVAASACRLAIFPLEDIAGLVEQPNLPGTTDAHPNWRRRMPCSTGELLAQPDIAARLAAIRRARA